MCEYRIGNGARGEAAEAKKAAEAGITATHGTLRHEQIAGAQGQGGPATKMTAALSEPSGVARAPQAFSKRRS